MKLFHDDNLIEVGVDECGRGTLVSDVYAAAVIWPKELNPDKIHPEMKDSKGYSKKKLFEMEKYVKDNCIAYSIGNVNQDVIDDINILNATYKAMHKAISNINNDFDSILVDGNRFEQYYDKNKEDWVPHTCIVKGDTKYYSIAAASILAKCEKDRSIINLCDKYPELDIRYKLKSNIGYASKAHRDGIDLYGITQFHRKTFGICKKYADNIIELEPTII